MSITKKSPYYALEISFDALTFSGQYADCGSHLIEMKITATRMELEFLLEQIKSKLEEKE